MRAATATVGLDLSGPGGAYLRVSDDDQEIGTQYVTLHDFEARHGIKIPKGNWYVDEGWSRDETDRRPAWLRMLADIDAGKLRWIVVTAKDRFGTASGRRKVLYYARLWDAGCKLLLASTGEVLNAPTLASDVSALVDGDAEQRELREKSQRALDKMRQHAADGRWMGGGGIPYGLDVVCMDAEGRERWRVAIDGPDMRVKIAPTGERERYDGPRNFPGRDRGQWLTLRPSLDPHRLAVVREIFGWFDAETLTTYQIAQRLNARGDRHPAGANAGAWEFFHVETLLRNAAYLGTPTWNKTTRGKWGQFADGRYQSHDEKQGRVKRHDAADWIVPDPQFPALIDAALFANVQDKLAARKSAPRAPKSADLWLSGILVCAHCKQPMHGSVRGDGRPAYICSTYLDGCSGARGCPFYLIRHDEAEQWVRGYLSETGTDLDAIAPTTTASQYPEAFWGSLMRAAEALSEVRQRTGHRDFTFFADEKADADALATYRQRFAEEAARDRARLDQLQADYRDQTLSKARTKSERQLAVIEQHLADLEAEIEQLENRTHDYATEYEEARRQFVQLRADWIAATQAVAAERGGRQKAGDVRKIISKIVIDFQPTGRNRPKYYAASATIVPVGADEGDGGGQGAERRPTTGGGDGEVRTVVPAGRPCIQPQGVTRDCGCGTRRSPSALPSATAG